MINSVQVAAAVLSPANTMPLFPWDSIFNLCGLNVSHQPDRADLPSHSREVCSVWLVTHQCGLLIPYLITPRPSSHSVLIQRGHLPCRGTELFLDQGT